MRIIVHGQQAFGKNVLESLLERGEEIVAVYCAPEKEGQRIDPLKEAALTNDIPVYQPKSYKDKDVQAEFTGLNADLCVMAYVTLLVPEDVLNAPKLGTVQYHPSLLPKHRGPSSINWPIIQGSGKTGLTIFWPDSGLDTGPVLLQKEIEIDDSDTLGSIYFNHLLPLGVEAMIEAVGMVRDGTAPRIIQDESQHSYESWCRKDDVRIDWRKPVQEVWNVIRGANPQPGAWSPLNGQDIYFYDAKKHTGDTGAKPGSVTAVGETSFTVATNGGVIEILRVRPDGERKIGSEEFIGSVKLQPGAQFGD